ncbi:MAG TPA: hypothetical protein VLA77_00095 [Candidatus Saccharimonadales bacterium]|nr:hypothetical protein [Candidatus Saccharimonadales bacterium]
MLTKLRLKIKYFIYILPLVWLLVVVTALNVTSPLVVGPAGILIIFCIFYALIASSVYVILLALGRLIYKMYGKKIDKKRLYFLSLIFSLAPIFMVALNSLGQLGPIELTLIALLVGLASFYVARRYETQTE